MATYELSRSHENHRHHQPEGGPVKRHSPCTWRLRPRPQGILRPLLTSIRKQPLRVGAIVVARTCMGLLVSSGFPCHVVPVCSWGRCRSSDHALMALHDEAAGKRTEGSPPLGTIPRAATSHEDFAVNLPSFSSLLSSSDP